MSLPLDIKLFIKSDDEMARLRYAVNPSALFCNRPPSNSEMTV